MVTDNHSDFGSSLEQEPEQLKQEAAPELAEPWHPDLARELLDLGLLGRVYQARRLRTFIQHLDSLESGQSDRDHEPPTLTDDLRLQAALSLRALAVGMRLPLDSVAGEGATGEIIVLDVNVDPERIVLSDVTESPHGDTWKGNLTVSCFAQFSVRSPTRDHDLYRRATVRGLVEVSAAGALAIRDVAVQLHPTLKETQEDLSRRLASHFEPLWAKMPVTDWGSDNLSVRDSEIFKPFQDAARKAAPDLREISGVSKLAHDVFKSPGVTASLEQIADAAVPSDLFNGLLDRGPRRSRTQAETDEAGAANRRENGED